MDGELQRLTSALSRYERLRLAILFGSLARGGARRDSDIDIAVLVEGGLDAELRISLLETITACTGRPVDLVDLDRIGEPLLGEVLRGRRLLGDDVTWGSLLSRHLIDAADFQPLQTRLLADRRRAWFH